MCPSPPSLPNFHSYNWLSFIILRFFSQILSFVCFCVLFFIFLVNPIASSHFENAQQQNLTSQNYSLHPNHNNTNVQATQMTNHHYDASAFNSTNNFNNFDQFQYQQSSNYQTQTTFEGGHNIQQQQIYQQSTQQQQAQFYGQSMMAQTSTGIIHQNHTQALNNGPTSTYQHTISDLLVQHPTSSYQQPQQNMYNNQVQTNQSSYNIAQLLDTSTNSTHINQQQNLNAGYYQNNLQQMQSSVCHTTSENHTNPQATAASFSTIDQSQLKIDQNHHYGNNHLQSQSQTIKADQQIPQVRLGKFKINFYKPNDLI